MPTITLSDSIMVRSAKLDGAQTAVSTVPFSAAFVEDAIQYAWDVRIQRAQAKVDKDDPDKQSKKAKERSDMFNRLSAGEIIKGGGGGGSRATLDERAWLEFFKVIGRKENGHPVNGKTLRRAQETLCRADLIQKYDAGTPERIDMEQNIGRHIKEKFEDWKTACEADPEDIGNFIRIEEEKERIKKITLKRR